MIFSHYPLFAPGVRAPRRMTSPAARILRFLLKVELGSRVGRRGERQVEGCRRSPAGVASVATFLAGSATSKPTETENHAD